MFRPRVVVLLLVLTTLLAYLPAMHNGFLSLDDDAYVSANPRIQGGMTWPAIKWAFTSFHVSNWHPLTWITHMVDYQVFRLNPSGHHLINILFHSANAGLLMVLMLRLTGSLWSSAFIAALFAWHPLHIESVAWIAELKDVSSTFWGLLALSAYVRYAKDATSDRPAVEGMSGNVSPPVARHPSRFYCLALVFFAMSLMCKSMLVTLPFVMLLLDCWPLQRRRNALRCLVEKLPFFLLAAGASVLTVLAQREKAMASLSAVPLNLRLENAVTAYAGYLWKAVWPAHLSIIYPLPGQVPWQELAVAALVLMVISLLAVFAARRQPWLPVGWLWYLGTLFPVIGLVQVGSQAMADRYTYFPLIGVFFAGTLAVGGFARRFQIPKAWLAVPAILILAACLLRTEHQLRYWRDSEVLFAHALEINPRNPLAHLILGETFQDRQEPAKALAEYQETLRLDPGCVEAYSNIGRLLGETGKPAEALEYCRTAVRLRPRSTLFHDRLGLVLVELGHYEAAKHEFSEALRLDPDHAPARFQMGRALLKKGNGGDAVKCFQEALRLEPNNLQMLNYTARVLAADKDVQVRDGAKACDLAQRAVKLTGGGQPAVLDTLAAAYAEAGRFDEAIATQRQAVELLKAHGVSEDEPAMQQRLELYQNKQPWRESFRGN